MLGRFLEDDSAIEFVYFGIIDWSASRTVTTGGNDLKLPSDLGQNITTNDFSGADQMTVSNISYLNNAEFHWLGTLSGSAWNGASVLAGFRYVGFNETLNIHASDVEPDPQLDSDYRIKTTNNLFGAQLGGRVARRNDRWGWDVTGKVGLFGNAARQEQYVNDDNNTFPIRPDVGEVGGSISSSRGSVHLSETSTPRWCFNSPTPGRCEVATT